MRDDAFESRVLRFERAWRQDGPCEIADYLKEPLPGPPDQSGRLLVELICIDLEFRWRRSGFHEDALLEKYVERFPELGSLEGLPLELIGEEYRVRCRWGDPPSHTKFLARFQRRQREIQAVLLQIDDECKEETPDSHHAAHPVANSLPAHPLADLQRYGALLSHHDFLLQRLIGAGTMGKVFEAWQYSTNRKVAVKFLRKAFLGYPQVVERFIGEAQTIARLRHPNIVGTQGFGRTIGGAYFIVMDLVTGPNLAQLNRQEEVSVDEAVRWALDTCDALAHAHEQGIVHCDLKPANLLLDESGKIRVTDFGLARSLIEETPRIAEVEGTAPFMAPEQASRCWGTIDHRTDVYGLGALLFTLLTGRPPYVGRRRPDILAAVVSASPVISPISLRTGLPQALGEICSKCLAKISARRYQSIQEVRSALAQFYRGE